MKTFEVEVTHKTSGKDNLLNLICFRWLWIFMCSLFFSNLLNKFATVRYVCVGFDGFTAVTMKSMVFWVVTPHSSEKARCFRETYCLCLQGWRVSMKPAEAGNKPDFQFTLFAACSCWCLTWLSFFTLKMEVICSSEVNGVLTQKMYSFCSCPFLLV
jgi:hypothetical protein